MSSWLGILGDNAQVAIEVDEHFEFTKANINWDSHKFKQLSNKQ